MMTQRYGMGDFATPGTVGVTVFDPSSDNAALLQQDVAIATAAANAPLAPAPSPFVNLFTGPALFVWLFGGVIAYRAGLFSKLSKLKGGTL